MFPTVELLEETGGRGIEELANNTEMHHICVGIRHNEAY
jgi:hypothetical protein